MFYYLVGVRMEGINSETPGKNHMDFVIEWTDKDLEAVKIAKGMTENYFWKTSDKEALEINGLSELAHNLHFAQVRARINDFLLLRYNTDFKVEEDDMAIYVEFTDLEELKKAKIPVRGL